MALVAYTICNGTKLGYAVVVNSTTIYKYILGVNASALPPDFLPSSPLFYVQLAVLIAALVAGMLGVRRPRLLYALVGGIAAVIAPFVSTSYVPVSLSCGGAVYTALVYNPLRPLWLASVLMGAIAVLTYIFYIATKEVF